MPFKVAFLGFSEFERKALASYFRLAQERTPSYEPVATLTDADFLVADADHGPSVQLVQATDRGAETVFIGAQAPPGCTAWMMRPIDALHVMRELDVMMALSKGQPAAGPAGIIVQAAGRLRAEPVPPAPQAPPTPPAPRAAAAPRRPAPAPTLLVPSSPPQRQAAPPAPAQPPRALLVDDSEIAQRYLESRLKRWRVQIDEAADSTQALEALARQSYDFVFLDVDLGDDSPLDGLGLCRHIKQSPSLLGATVILVSANHSELDRARGSLAGCDAFLGKPLDEVELQRLLLRQGLKLSKDEGATQA
jgi:CheY-like chemotaxis protein